MNRTTTKRPETHCTGQDCRTFFTRNPGDGGVVRSTVAPTLCVGCAPRYPLARKVRKVGGPLVVRPPVCICANCPNCAPGCIVCAAQRSAMRAATEGRDAASAASAGGGVK